jgi:hypothetical protein
MDMSNPEEYVIVMEIHTIIENSGLTEVERKVIEKIYFEDWESTEATVEIELSAIKKMRAYCEGCINETR